MNAICIASGPSLTKADIAKCRKTRRTVYVVNDVYKWAPWAHFLYAADTDWWNYHEGAQGFMGSKWGPDKRCCDRWGLNHIEGTSSKVFGLEKPIAYGKNSGFQAINLAFVHGHRDIWLLGYDMGLREGIPKHFFGDHPQKINRPSQYKDWIEHFKKAKPIMDEAGLKITNMTRETSLCMFDMGIL